MSPISHSLYNLRYLDELARGNTLIHRVNPLAKLLTTVFYLITVVSFDKYEISGFITLMFYPAIVMTLAEIPAGAILKRILLVEPLIIGIGILNPIFDQMIVSVAGFTFSIGWITFLSIFLKCGLTVAAALLLIGTTGMDKIGVALRRIKVPRLFVLQFLLTYRYISVLMEEIARILRAYHMRAPEQKGIQRNAWGSLLGQLIFRTYERAERVYQAMCLRGFAGEYHTGYTKGMGAADYLYLGVWVFYFLAARFVNIPALLGLLITGGNGG